MDGGKEASAEESAQGAQGEHRGSQKPDCAIYRAADWHQAYAQVIWRESVHVLITVIFVLTVVVLYYRYREHFYALESATDSNKGHTFWTILALVFAIVLAVCYFIFFF
jgi:heme/copper-type cytochrome/quinol oxidase subunit 2